jgi:hypothetical protein
VPKADNLPPSCADVEKSGGLNLVEPCGPVQACNGAALPFTIGDGIMNYWWTDCRMKRTNVATRGHFLSICHTVHRKLARTALECLKCRNETQELMP